MAAVGFHGGDVGIKCGNQQFTVRSFVCNSCRTAIDLLRDWGWTWKAMFIGNVDTAVRVNGTYRGGSLLFLDSFIWGAKTGFKIITPKGATDTEQFTLTLDSVQTQKV